MGSLQRPLEKMASLEEFPGLVLDTCDAFEELPEASFRDGGDQ